MPLGAFLLRFYGRGINKKGMKFLSLNEVDIFNIRDYFLDQGKLVQTLAAIKRHIVYVSNFRWQDRLDEIEEDYKRMLKVMENGLADDKRESYYEQLLVRTSQLLQDLCRDVILQENTTYARAARHAKLIEERGIDMRSYLERFVQDVDRVSLQPAEQRQEALTLLYKEHHDYTSRFFDALYTAPQWTTQQVKYYVELLCSDSIESIDAQLLTSAIGFSCMQLFDIAKLEALSRIYVNCNDEKVRQRALVGWALSLHPEYYTLLAAQRDTIFTVLQRPGTAALLVGLQNRVLLCVGTENANDVITQDLLPKLAKAQKKKFDISELDEAESDSPQVSEEAKQMAESLRRIEEMNKAGVDIHYSGFSSMKRIPFFYTLSNWLVPFYDRHPELGDFWKLSTKSKNLLAHIMYNGMFCDSDRYSCAFSYGEVLKQVPQELYDIVSHNAEQQMNLFEETPLDAEQIQLLYLRDLYRLFNLFSEKDDFRNCFYKNESDSEINLFLLDADLFGGTEMEEYFTEILQHLALMECSLNYTCRETLLTLYQSYMDRTDRDFLYYFARLAEMYVLGEDRIESLYEDMLELDDEDVKALKGLMRCYLRTKDYEGAVEIGEQLVQLCPNSVPVKINYCLALIATPQRADALPILHQLVYEHEERGDVRRVLAWAQSNMGNYAQACKEYAWLRETNQYTANDALNEGYALWLQGKMEDAIRSFHTFMTRMKEEEAEDEAEVIEEAFMNDEDFLMRQGKNPVECRLMLDILIQDVS